MHPFYPLIMQIADQPIVVEVRDSQIQVVISTVAVAIASIALIFSGLSLWMQRSHNIKSVRPVGYVELHDSLQGLSVKIVNKGCGPMLIKEFAAVRNELTKHNVVYHLAPGVLNGFTHQSHSAPEGFWLTPGGELMLLSLKGDDADPRFVQIREHVRAILGEITVRLTFCDVYDKQHPVFEKSLVWFKREL